MVQPVWNLVAGKMADMLRGACPARPQGIILVHHADPDHLIVWLYDCDSAGLDPLLECELKLLRRRLQETGVEELGFGFSQDGRAWTLVGRADQRGLRTRVGKAFFREMLAEDLSETWQRVALAAQMVGAQRREKAFAEEA